MRCGHAKCLQNCGERVRAAGQLSEAMLDEAVPDNQTQWDRSPAGDRRTADQIDGEVAPHWRPSLEVAHRAHTESTLDLSASGPDLQEVKETTLDGKT